MLNEEASHLGSTSIALSAPGAPTLTARAANSGESALTGITTNVFVEVNLVAPPQGNLRVRTALPGEPPPLPKGNPGRRR